MTTKRTSRQVAKTEPSSAPFQAPTNNIHSTNNIDNVESLFHNRRVLRKSQIEKALTQQTKDDSAELKRLSNEMDSLRSAYTRYKDLEIAARNKEERIINALAVMDSAGYDQLKAIDSSGVNVDVDRDNVPLWKMMREIVRQVSEIQIIELENLLADFGIPVSRAAIDSALKTHKDVFRTVVKGREKYVSLKGA